MIVESLIGRLNVKPWPSIEFELIGHLQMMPHSTPGEIHLTLILRLGQCLVSGVVPHMSQAAIRSYYISSSHTRLIRCLPLTGLSQARIDESGNTNFVILPHTFTLYVAVERPRSNDITRLKRRKAFQAFHRCYNPFTMHQMVAIEPLCL